jgi:hypothetical protein
MVASRQGCTAGAISASTKRRNATSVMRCSSLVSKSFGYPLGGQRLRPANRQSSTRNGRENDRSRSLGGVAAACLYPIGFTHSGESFRGKLTSVETS